jgi:predicted DsbA family dithiol-disulfide isomerase
MAVHTDSRGVSVQQGKPQDIDFYFDPVCPWAWRTSLWIREVAKVRPISVHWKFLSLELINSTRPGGQVKDSHLSARDPFRVMALARRQQGDDAVDRLYSAFGEARHERKENIGERDVILACLEQAGLDGGLLDHALADESTRQEIQREEEAIAEVAGFGVPTIVIDGFDPMFGPVINPVPSGEEAGLMWDHTEYFIRRQDFFELKREKRR